MGIPREEKTLRASKGRFSSERLSEAFPPLVSRDMNSIATLKAQRSEKIQDQPSGIEIFNRD